MARQYILSSFPYPVFVNETVTNQHIMPVVFLNETSSTAATTLFRKTLIALGSRIGSRQVEF
jgi:hypothetical protein